jgi:hypothetical protein
LHVLVVLRYISTVRRAGDEITEGEQNPVVYLKFLMSSVSACHRVTYIWILWNRSGKFLKLVQDLNEQNIKVAKASLIWPTCAMYFGAVILVTTVLELIALISSEAFPISRITYVAGKLDSEAFLEELLLVFPLQYEQSKAILCILYMGTVVAKRTISYGGECLLFMISLSAWNCAKRLSSKINITTSGSFSKMHLVDVVSCYESTKVLFTSINETVQPIFLVYVLEASLFYSVSLKTILSLSVESVFVSVFFISFLIIFTLAAEAHESVNEMKMWLSQPTVREHLSEAELSYLRFDVQANPVGLSGNRIFSVNYNLATCVSFVLFEMKKTFKEFINEHSR